jgi:hypothetical protein
MTARDAGDMSALSPPASPCSPNHVLSHPRMLGDAGRIGLLLRYRNRQKQIDGHTERPTDLLMQRYRTLALPCFEIGKIALGDADGDRKLVLRHGAPFAQHPNGVLMSRQPIHNSLWQHDLETGRDLLARVTHDASCPDIFVGDKPGKPIVFALRKDGELLAACGLDELNLGHDTLSIIDLSSMTDGDNNDNVTFSVEYDPPVAHTQPGAGTPFKPLDVTLTGLGKARELGVETPAHAIGEIKPLPCRSGGEHDLHDDTDIANRDISVNRDISYCDIVRCP